MKCRLHWLPTSNCWCLVMGGILVLMLAACSTAPTATAPTLAPVGSGSGGSSGSGTGGSAASTPAIQPPVAPTVPPVPAIQPPVAPTVPPVPAIQPPVAPTVPPVPIIPQQITIDSPPSGTLVGSPVVITGRLNRFPAGGLLQYRFTSANGAQLGVGQLPVNGSIGQPAAFNAQVGFALPLQGGPIRVEIFEQASGQIIAASALEMLIAPPQAITITSPPPGTVVGSPMVITGQLARLPYQSNMAYRVVNAQGAQLGAGIVPVQGQPGRPTSFTASLPFALPFDGGAVRVELIDQNAADNTVAASAVLPLQVAAVQQSIVFDSPAGGTQVGSPVVITGRTARPPFQGNLAYRVTGPNGAQLGAGIVNVNSGAGQPGAFTAAINFALPPNGGVVRVYMEDQNGTNGFVAAWRAVDLFVAPPAPQLRQAIIIDSPFPNSIAPTRLRVTGRTTLMPYGNSLTYRVADNAGNVLAQGSFVVQQTGQGSVFDITIALSGLSRNPLTLTVVDRSAESGTVIATAEIPLLSPLQPR